MPDSYDSSRNAALQLHRRGQIREAASLYRALLDSRPDDADVLGLLALAVEQEGDAAQAEALLRAGLSKTASVSITHRNANNLMVLLLEAGRQEDARALAVSDLPAWPSDSEPDEIEQGTLMSLFDALVTLDRTEAALRLVKGALPYLTAHADFLRGVASLLIKAGRAQEAAEIVAGMQPEDTPDGTVLILQSAAAFAAGDIATARKKTEAFVLQAPIVWAEREPGQQATIVVLNAAPSLVREPDRAAVHHYTGNYPSQLSQRISDRFRFVSVLADSPAASPQALGGIGPAVVVNNIVNAEMLSTPDTLETVAGFADRLGLPVINHPRTAVHMTRQKNAGRFALMPGVTAPRVLRFLLDRDKLERIVSEIVTTLGERVIIRTVFAQMGAGTTLCEGAAAIRACLLDMNEAEFYAIELVLSKHQDGLYRQLRLGSVNGRTTLLRADFCDHWNVRARRNARSKAFYQARPEMLGQANAIVNDPASWLDAGALQRLQDVASQIPLQIFGMDFDINEQGQIVIFEVNATMNLLTTSEGAEAYPEKAEKQMLAEMERFFLSLAR